MAKKELTRLLIAFLGGWLLFQAVLSLYSAIYSAVGLAITPSRAQNDVALGIFTLAFSILPIVVWSFLGILTIRKSGSLAVWLLKSAKIEKEEKIEGISFRGILPGLVSLMGLYFILIHLPQFVISGVKWFALEARSMSMNSIGGPDQFIQTQRSGMIYHGTVIVTALLVFLRADLLAQLTERFSRKSNQSVGQIAGSSAPRD